MAEPILRGERGRFAPGNKASSGRRTSVSLVRTMREDLEAHPEKIIPIWENLYQLSLKPDFRALEAIDKILDRLDGKPASEVTFKGVIAHISDEYAAEVLAAMSRGELERENRLMLSGGDQQSG